MRAKGKNIDNGNQDLKKKLDDLVLDVNTLDLDQIDPEKVRKILEEFSSFEDEHEVRRKEFDGLNLPEDDSQGLGKLQKDFDDLDKLLKQDYNDKIKDSNEENPKEISGISDRLGDAETKLNDLED